MLKEGTDLGRRCGDGILCKGGPNNIDVFLISHLTVAYAAFFLPA